MDIDLRLVLILLGVVILAVIIWDGYRKKNIAKEKAAEFNQDTLNEMMNTRDNGGFDLTGVGLSRIIGDHDFQIDEPLTASRDDDPVIGEEAFGEPKPSDIEPTSKSTGEPELIITLSIVARAEDGFVGDKLLHCMLSRGLRYGAMNIFHRHKNISGEGQIQFSLANAIKPGTFDLDDMSSFATKAVTLFMILPGPNAPLKSYTLMLATAEHLGSELNGQLVDGSRSILTQQTIQHYQEKIQDFERCHLDK